MESLARHHDLLMDSIDILDAREAYAYIIGCVTGSRNPDAIAELITAVTMADQAGYKVPDWLFKWAGETAAVFNAIEDALGVVTDPLF